MSYLLHTAGLLALLPLLVQHAMAQQLSDSTAPPTSDAVKDNSAQYTDIVPYAKTTAHTHAYTTLTESYSGLIIPRNIDTPIFRLGSGAPVPHQSLMSLPQPSMERQSPVTVSRGFHWPFTPNGSSNASLQDRKPTFSTVASDLSLQSGIPTIKDFGIFPAASTVSTVARWLQRPEELPSSPPSFLPYRRLADHANALDGLPTSASLTNFAVKRLRLQRFPRTDRGFQTAKRHFITYSSFYFGGLILAFLLLMVPNGGIGNRGSDHRAAPAWGPEGERHYSFRAYIVDLMHWVMVSDYQPHQQAASILRSLTGAAREITRTVTGPEIMNGGIHNGVAYDPVGYIIAGLRSRFGQLDEETRMSAMNEMLAFARRPGENINMILSRYDLVRGRARNEGQFVMAVEGCAMQLLRACGTNPTQMMQLLQPLNYRLPNSEEEFTMMRDTMRRIGHVLEHSPNNIGQGLHGPTQARPGEYLTYQEPDQQTSPMFLSTPTVSTVDPWHQPTQPNDAPMYASWPAPMHAPAQQTSLFGGAGPAEDTQATDEMFLVGGEDILWSDSGTDSDTSSDSGTEHIDMSEYAHLTPAEASERAFLNYRFQKKTWRRLTKKPVRRVRRFVRKNYSRSSSYRPQRRTPGRSSSNYRSYHFGSKGKGKGKNKGKGSFTFHTADDMNVYLKGQGKGNRAHTTGMGHGRTGNPKGSDGQPITCHGCGSTEHLVARCPNNTKGAGKGATAAAPAFLQSYPPQVQAVAAAYPGPQSSNVPGTVSTVPGYLTINQQPDVDMSEFGGPLDDLLGTRMTPAAAHFVGMINQENMPDASGPPRTLAPPDPLWDASQANNDAWQSAPPGARPLPPPAAEPNAAAWGQWAQGGPIAQDGTLPLRTFQTEAASGSADMPIRQGTIYTQDASPEAAEMPPHVLNDWLATMQQQFADRDVNAVPIPAALRAAVENGTIQTTLIQPAPQQAPAGVLEAMESALNMPQTVADNRILLEQGRRAFDEAAARHAAHPAASIFATPQVALENRNSIERAANLVPTSMQMLSTTSNAQAFASQPQGASPFSIYQAGSTEGQAIPAGEQTAIGRQIFPPMRIFRHDFFDDRAGIHPSVTPSESASAAAVAAPAAAVSTAGVEVPATETHVDDFTRAVRARNHESTIARPVTSFQAMAGMSGNGPFAEALAKAKAYPMPPRVALGDTPPLPRAARGNPGIIIDSGYASNLAGNRSSFNAGNFDNPRGTAVPDPLLFISQFNNNRISQQRERNGQPDHTMQENLPKAPPTALRRRNVFEDILASGNFEIMSHNGERVVTPNHVPSNVPAETEDARRVRLRTEVGRDLRAAEVTLAAARENLDPPVDTSDSDGDLPSLTDGSQTGDERIREIAVNALVDETSRHAALVRRRALWRAAVTEVAATSNIASVNGRGLFLSTGALSPPMFMEGAVPGNRDARLAQIPNNDDPPLPGSVPEQTRVALILLGVGLDDVVAHAATNHQLAVANTVQHIRHITDVEGTYRPEMANAYHSRSPAGVANAANSAWHVAEDLPGISMFSGTDEQCTMCTNDFEHGDRVCRLRCMHVFHTSCFHQYHVAQARGTRGPCTCPNCRGEDRIIAIWSWIDPSVTTQWIGHTGVQVANELDAEVTGSLAQIAAANAVNVPILTPRSVETTEDFQSHQSDELAEPEGDSQTTSDIGVSVPPRVPVVSTTEDAEEFVGIIMPATFQDFRDWQNTPHGTALGETRIPSSSTPQPPLPNAGMSFHTETRLRDGRESILIDPGSVGNLGGDGWVQSLAKAAIASGRVPEQAKRDRALHISGVGHGSQTCTHNCKLPVAFKRTDGTVGRGNFNVPVVPKSELPGLLGLKSLRDRRAILDMQTLQIHFAGPGDYDLSLTLPPGTESYQCELAPSGHMVLPCSEFAAVDAEESGSLDTGAEVSLPVSRIAASSSSSGM